MKIKFITAILAVMSIVSCSNDRGQDASAIDRCPSGQGSFIILQEELPYGWPNDIWADGGNVFVMSYDRASDSFCQVFDSSDGGYEASLFRRGNGHGEVLDSGSDTFIHGGRGRYVDHRSRKVLTFDVDSVLNFGPSAVSEERIELKPYTRRSIAAGEYRLDIDDSSVKSPDKDISRLNVFDPDGNVLAASDFYPVEEKEKIQPMYGMYGLAAVSPDGTKLVLSSTLGGIIEMYDLPGLTARKISSFVTPEFDPLPGSYSYNEKSVAGFRDLFATDNRVYAAYDGKTMLKSYYDQPSEERAPAYNRIVIFNWNGKPLRQIVTDMTIVRLCVDEDESNIYAVVEGKDGIMSLAKLPL